MLDRAAGFRRYSRMAMAIQPETIAETTAAEPIRFHCVGCGGRRCGWRPVVPADPESRPFDLLRCADCGLVQQHPRARPATLAGLYGEDYYVFDESSPDRWARAVQQYVIHILPHEAGSPKRLLDVGCALGHLAVLARERGWRVVGLDVSPRAVSRAVLEFGLDARAGHLSQYRSTLPPFDLVFLGDVIEHVADPQRLLSDVHALLSPDGVVCIDTPNFGSRWRWLGRRRWLGLNRYHVNFFDAECLSRLLAQEGFVGITTGSYTNYRYEPWSTRPEVRRLVEMLPGFLAWRLNRWLGRLRFSRSLWSRLRAEPPTTSAEANRRIRDLARSTPGWSHKSTGDNLIASAVRAGR